MRYQLVTMPSNIAIHQSRPRSVLSFRKCALRPGDCKRQPDQKSRSLIIYKKAVLTLWAGKTARNAELNGITNAEFAAGEAEVVIPKWYKEGNTADVLVVDPPRKGCDEALLQTIIEMKPKRLSMSPVIQGH